MFWAADKNSFFTQLQLLEEEEGQAGQEISIVDYGAFMLVGIGVAILVQSLLGCISTVLGCCGNRRAKGCLITYGILITIVVIVEIVAAVLVLNVFHAEVSEETKQFLEKTLKTDYKHPSEGKKQFDHHSKLDIFHNEKENQMMSHCFGTPS